MKTKIFLLFLILLHAGASLAARFEFLPYRAVQPDGSAIDCFVSGDEYFNWLHDKDGYTLIQAPDGYYYWGVQSGETVVPTAWRADRTDPAGLNLPKWAKISLARYNERKAFYRVPGDRVPLAPHEGTLNNLAVYIRFNDDTEFTMTRQAYDGRFNASSGISLKSYYSEVSYNHLTISTTHYPDCPMTINLSYKDSHDRDYFRPYNAVTNPVGYMDDSERTFREHTLLRDAIEWINLNSPVPAGLDIDGDLDGLVDNVCFIIRGGNDAWAELLWAHRWSLFSYNVNINGKRVMDYTFQPETQVDVQTLCHEMFHALGSPDLYHYSSDGKTPVGDWDLMENGFGHMGAYMKWKYTNNTWITEMPWITAPGTYTLRPLSNPTGNCYRIASPYSSSQFFVVEYRKKTGTFEGSIPGSGLLVYRIDASCDGNAGGPPDEVYIYRPNGTLSNNGVLNNAYFSAETNRTKINDQTNPSSFLQNGSAGGLRISKVTSADTTISFTVDIIYPDNPSSATATATGTSEILLKWTKHPQYSQVMVAFDTTGTFGTPVNGTIYQPGGTIPGGGRVIYTGTGSTFTHPDLLSQKKYYYRIWSLKPGNAYSPGLSCQAVTLCPAVTILPFREDFESGPDMPSCWYEDNDDPAWQFIQGNGLAYPYGYPASAHGGTRNACLIDATTAADITTLLTPLIDLTSYSGVRLSFWLHKQKWGSRQDELKVSYRTSPTEPWIQLKNYTSNVNAWTEEIIDLPDSLGVIQIGFTGTARWGLGICIDDILIDGTPQQSVQVSPVSRQVTSLAGSTTFDVACPASWTAVSDAVWCTVTANGTGNGILTATFAENPVYSPRTALVTVSSAGLLPQTVTITQEASKLSAAEHASDGITLFPNPTTGLTLIRDASGSFRIRGVTVNDLSGIPVIHKTGQLGNDVMLDLSGQPAGTYFVRITGESTSVSRKIVVVK